MSSEGGATACSAPLHDLLCLVTSSSYWVTKRSLSLGSLTAFSNPAALTSYLVHKSFPMHCVHWWVLSLGWFVVRTVTGSSALMTIHAMYTVLCSELGGHPILAMSEL
jgi:hypothetical protein